MSIQDQLDKAWAEIVENILQQPGVGRGAVEALFPRLKPQAMSSGFLMLTADNDFIKNWIECNYLSLIKNTLKDIYGVPFTVFIEVDVNQEVPAAVAAREDVKSNTADSIDVFVSYEEPKKAPVESTTSNNDNTVTDNESEGGFASTVNFDNFVVGDSNQMAFSMARRVADNPGIAHLNPLFIYGKSGLGKTHLLLSIKNQINKTRPSMKVVYADSSELVNDFVETVAGKTSDKSFRSFKNRYEDVDVLLVDDVQFLQGKKATLDAVFQIFNTLVNQGKQVVLSADRAPKNIDIDERYVSRFNQGGTVDIQPPEIETKLGIIMKFIEEYHGTEGIENLDIDDDIRLYIAEKSSSNIRELKSAVTKVIYQAITNGRVEVTMDEVQKILENHFSGSSSKHLTAGDIQRIVEDYYKVSHADLIGSKRSRNITYARQMAMYLCHQMLDMSNKELARQFNRDHTTVTYSLTCVKEKVKSSREIHEEMEYLLQQIKDL